MKGEHDKYSVKIGDVAAANGKSLVVAGVFSVAGDTPISLDKLKTVVDPQYTTFFRYNPVTNTYTEL